MTCVRRDGVDGIRRAWRRTCGSLYVVEPYELVVDVEVDCDRFLLVEHIEVVLLRLQIDRLVVVILAIALPFFTGSERLT